MNTTLIRQHLHNFLEIADDKKVKAIYTIFEKDIHEKDEEYSDEMKSALDKRDAAYKNGTAKIVTAEESRKRINKKLKGAGRK